MQQKQFKQSKKYYFHKENNWSGVSQSWHCVNFFISLAPQKIIFRHNQLRQSGICVWLNVPALTAFTAYLTVGECRKNYEQKVTNKTKHYRFLRVISEYIALQHILAHWASPKSFLNFFRSSVSSVDHRQTRLAPCFAYSKLLQSYIRYFLCI